LTVTPSTENERVLRLTNTLLAPTMHGRPIPRATRAAWLAVPPVSREDAFRLHHAVHVVRVRLDTDQDHSLALLAPLLGSVGVEYGLAGGGARGGGHAARERLNLGRWVDTREQKLLQLARLDARDRLFAI